MINKNRPHNINQPSSAAAVVFGVHLSAQFRESGIEPDTSGQSGTASGLPRLWASVIGSDLLAVILKNCLNEKNK